MAAGGRGRFRSTAGYVVSLFPPLGLAHRPPGFSRTRVGTLASAGLSAGSPAGCGGVGRPERAECLASAGRAGEETASGYRSLQWEGVGYGREEPPASEGPLLCPLRAPVADSRSWRKVRFSGPFTVGEGR